MKSRCPLPPDIGFLMVFSVYWHLLKERQMVCFIPLSRDVNAPHLPPWSEHVPEQFGNMFDHGIGGLPRFPHLQLM
jgi:hypothetical protein